MSHELHLFSFLRAQSRAGSAALRQLAAPAWALHLQNERGTAGHDALVWVTCERAEILWAGPLPAEGLAERAAVLLADEPAGRAALAAAGRVLHGEEVVRHLFRLAAGLDSRLLGEEEIARQLRAALRARRALGRPDARLTRALGWALQSGDRARRELDAGGTRRSWARAVTHLLQERFGGQPARLALVGTGQLAESLAEARARELPGLRLRVYGAHAGRPLALAERFGGQARDLGDLIPDLGHTDVAIFATRARQPLVHAENLPADQPLLLIDLGEPPLVSPEVATLPGIERWDLRTLEVAAGIPGAQRLAAAEARIEEDLALFRQRYGQKRALVLAAHGVGEGSAANTAVLALAASLQELLPQTEVLPAFRLGSPTWAETFAARAVQGGATVVPLLAAEGFFARQVLPREIATAGLPAASLRPPLGRHTWLHDGIADRLRLELANAPDAGILLAAHGTRRDDGSGNTAAELAALIGQRHPEHLLRVGFLDQEPSLEAAAQELAHLSRVVLLPFFLGGEHAAEDLPRRARAGLGPGPRLELLGPLLEESMLIPTLLDLAGQRRSRRLRLGSRKSRLALVQAEQVRRRLGARGIAVELVLFDTHGDRDQRRPIEELDLPGPFTDELDAALRAGQIDLAVHSLKDLPLGDPPGLELAAFLPRGPLAEALVGGQLARLPAGARVGTCSRRRQAQLENLRPDLRPLPVRGTVEQRLAQLDAGHYDALILAEAGLSRLGLGHRVGERLPLGTFLPEPGQGVIVLAARKDDAAVLALAAEIDHAPTREAASAEREAARQLENEGGSVATYARFLPGFLELNVRFLPAGRGPAYDACARHRFPAEAVRLATLSIRRQQALAALQIGA